MKPYFLPMKPIKYLVLLICMYQFTSCSKPPTYHIQREARLEHLNIALVYKSGQDSLDTRIQKDFNQALDEFVQTYNSEKHPLKVSAHPDSTQQTLHITILGTKLVSPEQQGAGVAVSLLGFATPFILAAAQSPIIVTFWYFPHDVSSVESTLSRDISAGPQLKSLTYVSNSGFLRKPEKQLLKHKEAFKRFLRMHVLEVEKAYRIAQTYPKRKTK